MLSGVRMTQSFLSLTLHRRWDEWYEDSGGNEAYGDCLLHSGSWSGGACRETPQSIMTDMGGD